MKSFNVKGYNCLVGKNAEENWKLLASSTSNDHFFHLSSFPSCYVILKCIETTVESSILMECAFLCLNNTKHAGQKDVYVDHTTVGNVIKGEKVGEVVYKSNKKVERIKL